MCTFKIKASYVDELPANGTASPASLPQKLHVVRPDGSFEPTMAVLREGFYEFDVGSEGLKTKLQQDLLQAKLEWSNSNPSVAYRIKIRVRPAGVYSAEVIHTDQRFTQQKRT